jgi:hypothetical protein
VGKKGRKVSQLLLEEEEKSKNLEQDFYRGFLFL